MTATIAQLRHFIALAESGSFTRGADSTRRSQAAMHLQAQFRLITTGTPIENHLGEFYTLFTSSTPACSVPANGSTSALPHPSSAPTTARPAAG